MRKAQYLDKEEIELAKSLEAEEWVSDLTKAKAIEEGLPYQSLISMLIHKYNEGKISVQD